MRGRTYNLNKEHYQQVELMKWAELARVMYPALKNLFAVPNGGMRHPAIAAQLKAEGVKPGVPDLCLAYPSNGFHALYIEMKRLKGGRLSDEQKDWNNRLTSAGYRVCVCAGWEIAKGEIVKYLTPTKQP